MTKQTSLSILLALATCAPSLMAQAVETPPVTEIPVVAPESVGMSAAGLGKVSEIMQGYVDDKTTVGGIVMIARKGKICFFESWGLSDLETNKSMEKDSILRFYSMTKAITTAAALMLHEEGKLDVKDLSLIHI